MQTEATELTVHLSRHAVDELRRKSGTAVNNTSGISHDNRHRLGKVHDACLKALECQDEVLAMTNGLGGWIWLSNMLATIGAMQAGKELVPQISAAQRDADR